MTSPENLLETLSRNEPAIGPGVVHADEAAFKHAWQQAAAGAPNPVLQALRGGLLADRLSFVFLAAYQAAVRACFSCPSPTDWYCFAVSEDRRGEIPGLALADGTLTGTKTWIAACAVVDQLIVTLGPKVTGDCLCLPTLSAGIRITSRDRAAFLGDMSQGSASFDRVPLAAAVALPMQADFGLAEAFFVLAASCGYLHTEAQRLGQPALAAGASDQAAALLALYPDQASQLDALVSIQAHISALGKQCAAHCAGKPRETDWRANGRLLGMYGAALRGRLARA